MTSSSSQRVKTSYRVIAYPDAAIKPYDYRIPSRFRYGLSHNFSSGKPVAAVYNTLHGVNEVIETLSKCGVKRIEVAVIVSVITESPPMNLYDFGVWTYHP